MDRESLQSVAAPDKGHDEKITLDDERNVGSSTSPQEAADEYLKGWKLLAITLALCLGLFLSALDTTIVSTSLVTISDDIGTFSKSSWVITTYLLTYTGFLVIWAKLSDIFGRKLFLMSALCFTVVFSGACGAAQTEVQLIVFRAFQGIGGSGIFAMGLVIVPELVPPRQYAQYNGIVSTAIGFSFLLGPLIGGAIDGNTTWRWIFLINLPIGVIALVTIFITMPTHFPQLSGAGNAQESSLKKMLKKVDFPGSVLLLGASILLVCALEETGTHFVWRSAAPITLLVISGILWIAFLVWENIATRTDSIREPIMPWRLMENRIIMGAFLLTVLAGVPFTTIIIELPQKFQTVNGASPLNAGIRLLPFSFSWPIASALTGPLTSGLRIPPIYVVSLGSVLQTVGLALSYSLNGGLRTSASQYGFEVLTGFGCGLTLTTLVLMAPFIVEKLDLAVTMGAITQCRVLGGAIGISMATNLLNNHIKSTLSTILSDTQLNAILVDPTNALNALEPDLNEHVRTVFAAGYKLQTRALLCFSAVEFLAIALMWQRRPRVIPTR